MADAFAALEAELRALRASYSAQLPSRIQQVEEAWEIAQHNPGSSEHLKTLHLLVHRLTGSGATYGFTALSEEARTLELYLKPFIDGETFPSEAQKIIITTLLNVLKEAALEPDTPTRVSEQEELAWREGLPHPEKESKLIFLTEDDSDVLQDLAHQIGHFGYSVRTFQEVDKLKEEVDKNPPAAIIMDIMFPSSKFAGTEVVAEIQRGREKPIPVAFISGMADLETRLRAVRAGGEAYFTKPIDVSNLIDKLDVLTAYQAPEPYRILIVDDDRPLAEFYALTLQQAGMKAVCITDPMQVMQPIIDFAPDLILMDVYMPQCTGKELASVIRQQEAYVSIPIVFLSSETDPAEQMDAMHQGGDDFLTKPIEANYLVSSVKARAYRSRILRSFVSRDSLTGLLNHTKTKEQLDLEIARAFRRKGSLVFAMLDIDHFKSVNDSYGHPAGDRVIKSLSRLLQQRLRKTDIIGRYGGEEFAVILLDTTGPAAAKVMDGIRDRFSQIRQHSEDAEFAVTFSCGLASYPAYPDGTSLNEAADKALYEAKRRGRNQTVLAE